MKALRAAEPRLAAEIERRAQTWIEQHGSEFPGDSTTGIMGETEAEQERFEAFANDAACPALDPATGRCDVYASRPMTCRVFGPPVRMDDPAADAVALGHCELCFQGASQAEVEACEMAVPHELEAMLLDEVADQRETVVAFALVRWADPPAR
jgi:Fe-S-cluster containining protein